MKTLKVNNKMKHVFLGGTCNGSQWREELIPMLEIDYFNPVVSDWNAEAQQKELEERETCDYVLYVITPKMKGVYSIAEAVDDSHRRPTKTIFCFLLDYDDMTFDEHQEKSLIQTSKLIEDNGAVAFDNLEDVADYLNYFGKRDLN